MPREELEKKIMTGLSLSLSSSCSSALISLLLSSFFIMFIMFISIFSMSDIITENKDDDVDSGGRLVTVLGRVHLL